MKHCPTCTTPKDCKRYDDCQQPPAKEKAGGPSDATACSPVGVEARVAADIAARQQVGILKYGTTVADNPLPLREWLEHAYQEALDLPIYLKRAIEEIDRQNAEPRRGENETNLKSD